LGASRSTGYELAGRNRPKTKRASLGSDRNDVGLRARLDEDEHDVSHSRPSPASSAGKVARADSPCNEKRSQGGGKRRSRARSKRNAARRFPPPHEPTISSRAVHDRRRGKVWKTASYATALWGALRPPFPTPAQRRIQKQLFPLSFASASALSPKQGDSRCSKTRLTNQTPYEPGGSPFSRRREKGLEERAADGALGFGDRLGAADMEP
jgi:hypothetical protein